MGNQRANTLYLQGWLLSSGIVCRARFPPSTLPRPWRIASWHARLIVPGLPNAAWFAEPARLCTVAASSTTHGAASGVR